MPGLLRLRTFWVACVVVVAVVAGSIALYVAHGRSSNPHPSTVAAGNVTPPPAASVGTTVVSTTPAAAVLTVVSTAPATGATGAAVSSPIAVTFNLPVDPAALRGYFLVLPSTPGAFTQGGTDLTVTFTPATPFAAGSTVSVDVRQGLTSQGGAVLDTDFQFSFITAVSSRDVLFSVNDQASRVYSMQSGQTATGQAQFGNEVPADLMLQTYAAKTTDLLAAQVHDASGNFLDQPIATGSLQLVDQTPLLDGQPFTLSRPDGVYLLLATDSEGQYGAMWLVVGKLGVLLRQDDQKMVIAGEDLATGDTTVAFTVALYNLTGGVHQVATANVSGTAEIPTKGLQPVDVIVASAGGEDVIVPVWLPQSGADLKVMGDLSLQPEIFLTTDRAGYQQGETVKFAGVVRMSNDQQYTVPQSTSVIVWSGNGPAVGQADIVRQAVPVAPDGTFSGSFVMPPAAFNTDGTDGVLTLNASLGDGIGYPFFSTLIQTIGPHSPAARITVAFDKPSYVSADTVTATITATDLAGKPLPGAKVALTLYSTRRTAVPSELGAYPAPSTWGAMQGDAPTPLVLGASGIGTFTFPANKAQIQADQEITLAATYGAGAAQAVGARSAVVYQALDEVYLLPSRQAYSLGESVQAQLVVENREGQRVTGMPVTYELDNTTYSGSTSTTTVVASGTVTTDANGLASVHAAYSGPEGGLFLTVKAKDTAGNLFEDSQYVTFQKRESQFNGPGVVDSLWQLSVTTDKIAYAAGDTARLTVTSPAAMSVLLSLERGRIHSYKWVSLFQGANVLDVPITPDLVPGFSVMFDYAQDGAYWTEGLPVAVNPGARTLNVTVTPDAQSYKPGQTAHVTIRVTDASGAAVAGSLIVDGFDAMMSAYKLDDTPSILAAFLAPSPRLTNGSSSLVDVGMYGGRCGGGGPGIQLAVAPPGRTQFFAGGLATDDGGQVTVDVPIGSGPVRLQIFAATSATAVGQTEMDLAVTA